MLNSLVTKGAFRENATGGTDLHQGRVHHNLYIYINVKTKGSLNKKQK